MISALAKAFQVLEDDRYLYAAIKAAQFIRDNLYKTDTKTLIRNYREGPSSTSGFCQDYAFLITGLVDLYEASFDIQWLRWAADLQARQNELFWDKNGDGFFNVAEGDKSLLFRTKEEHDGAEPSENSYAALNLQRLGQMLGRSEWLGMARRLFLVFSKELTQAPIVLPQMAVAVDFFIRTPKQLVIAMPSTATAAPDAEKKGPKIAVSGSDDLIAMLRLANSQFLPNKVMLLVDDASRPFLSEQNAFLGSVVAKDGKATAYVCEHFTCQLPSNDRTQIARLLGV